jgi:hypothetical protein
MLVTVLCATASLSYRQQLEKRRVIRVVAGDNAARKA